MYLIKFPNKLNSEVFEIKLKQFTIENNSTTIQSVSFDLSAVTLYDPYPLCLVLLWMKSIKDKGLLTEIKLPTFSRAELQEINFNKKEVDSKLDKKRKFFSFLVQSRFIEIVEKLKLEHNINDFSASNRRPKKIDTLISPFLLWSNWDNFKDFVTALNSPEQYELFYNDVLKYQIVKSGKMRDVIFRELGDNIFQHAEGKTGILVMNRGIALEYGAPDWEKPFFEKISKTEYLEIVISDLGQGIHHTLKKTYKETEGKLPTNSEAMIYALQQYTTSKTKEERLSKLKQVLESRNELEVLPATGLYWVKDVAKEFNALFTIRSKNSILVYDFLNHPNRGNPKIVEYLEVDGKKLKLADLDGVQIKLCFPAMKEATKYQDKSNKLLETHSIKKYTLFRLKLYFSGSKVDDLDSQAEALLKLLNEIEKEKNEIEKENPKGGKVKIIIVDFDDIVLSNKTFFILGIELMRIQDSNFIIVPINANNLIHVQNQLAEFCSQAAISSSTKRKEKLLFSLDDNLNWHLLGLERNLESALKKIIFKIFDSTDGYSLTAYENDLLAYVKHLLYKSSNGKYAWNFSFARIQNSINESLVESISNIILHPGRELEIPEMDYRIFHSNKWFLIPSQSYCYGFFEIGKLLIHQKSKDKIIRWLKIKFQETSPQVIISIGNNEYLSSFQKNFSQDIRWVNIDNPDDPASWIKLAFVEKHQKILLLTDVIGTAATLKKVIERLTTKEIVKILTIVDARKENQPLSHIRIDGTNYETDCILRFPIKFESNLPEGCTYQDITVIDTLSKSPIWSLPFESDAVWKDFDKFLDEVIKPSKAIMTGHFSAGDKHILYLFLTPNLADYFAVNIVDRMRRDLQLSYQKMRIGQSRISAFMYPEHSKGTEIISEKFRSLPEFLDSIDFPISDTMLNNPTKYNWPHPSPVHDAVIFDDATSSGSTIDVMIDLAESWGAKNIFVYILFNRCDVFKTRMLEKKKGYGKSKVEVRFLTNVSIPVYNSKNCPVCKTISELEEAKQFNSGNPEIVRYLEERIDLLRPYPIEFVWKNLSNQYYLVPDIDRAIKRAKYRMLLQLGLEDNPHISNLLAKLTRTGSVEDVLLFFLVIAKEKNFFIDHPKLNELFYPDFRKDLLNKARKIYKNPLKLKPKELDAVITVIKIFDEDIYLTDLERLVKQTFNNDQQLLVIISNFLLSRKSQRQPKFIDELISKSDLNDLKPQKSLFPVFPPPFEEENSHATSKIFEEILRRLHPSKGPDVKFLALKYDIDFYLKEKVDFEQAIQTIESQWKEIRIQLHDVILPKIVQLKEVLDKKNLSLSVVDQLNAHLDKINSYLKATNEYFEFIRESDEEERIEILSLFGSYIEELKIILCSSEKSSLHQTICEMTSEIRQKVRKCLDMNLIKDLIKNNSIDYVLKLPENSCFVFCHPTELTQMIFNLIENLPHAFKKKYKERKAEISVYLEEDYVYFTVKDNGDVGNFPFQLGVGLQEVQSIALAVDGSFINPKPISDDIYNKEVGFRLKYIIEELRN